MLRDVRLCACSVARSWCDDGGDLGGVSTMIAEQSPVRCKIKHQAGKVSSEEELTYGDEERAGLLAVGQRSTHFGG